MNKNKVKKNIEYKDIGSILNKSIFIGFLAIQNMSIKDKSFLKDFLSHSIFDYKIVNSNLLNKGLTKLVSKTNLLSSGPLAICYLTKNSKEHDKESLFKNIQRLLNLSKKNKNTIFLGNLFYSLFYDKLFGKKVSSLTSLSTTNLETSSLIQFNSVNLLTQFIKPKTELSLILAKNKAN